MFRTAWEQIAAEKETIAGGSCKEQHLKQRTVGEVCGDKETGPRAIERHGIQR
jgi:hypothetical protein